MRPTERSILNVEVGVSELNTGSVWQLLFGAAGDGRGWLRADVGIGKVWRAGRRGQCRRDGRSGEGETENRDATATRRVSQPWEQSAFPTHVTLIPSTGQIRAFLALASTLSSESTFPSLMFRNNGFSSRIFHRCIFLRMGEHRESLTH